MFKCFAYTRTHTHTHTHTRTQQKKCIHTHMHTCAQKYTRTHTQTDLHTHTHMHTCTLTHTNTHTHSHEQKKRSGYPSWYIITSLELQIFSLILFRSPHNSVILTDFCLVCVPPAEASFSGTSSDSSPSRHRVEH